MARHVVVVIDADGTMTVWGNESGYPTFEDQAEALAAHFRMVANATAYVRPILHSSNLPS